MLKQTHTQENGRRPSAGSLLHQDQGEFRHLLEKMPAGAYLCDPDGLITYFNQRAVEVWGRAPKLNHPDDRFCGSFKLFTPDGAPIRHNQCWMALALRDNAEYNGYEIVIERPDGDRLTALAYANPIRDESGRLMGAFNLLVDISDRKVAEAALRQARDELEWRVAERTAALAASNERLEREIAERKQAEALARQLSHRLLTAEEEERKRLSRELHDSVGQMTTALLINLSLLSPTLPPGSEGLRADLEMACELAQKIHREVRAVSHTLRPPGLEVVGLNEALGELCRELSGVVRQPVVYQGAAVPPTPGAITVAFYRFVQEALNNAFKHAQAGALTVGLQYEEGHLRVTVADDGVGFDSSAHVQTPDGRGVGLLSMRERLEMVGGELTIDSAPGRGARLVAAYPLSQGHP